MTCSAWRRRSSSRCVRHTMPLAKPRPRAGPADDSLDDTGPRDDRADAAAEPRTGDATGNAARAKQESDRGNNPRSPVRRHQQERIRASVCRPPDADLTAASGRGLGADHHAPAHADRIAAQPASPGGSPGGRRAARGSPETSASAPGPCARPSIPSWQRPLRADAARAVGTSTQGDQHARCAESARCGQILAPCSATRAAARRSSTAGLTRRRVELDTALQLDPDLHDRQDRTRRAIHASQVVYCATSDGACHRDRPRHTNSCVAVLEGGSPR